MILALIDDNSSIIYYRATAALCPPDPAETVEAKHAKSRRIFERRKNRVHNLKESLKSYTCSGQSEEQEKDSVNISEEQDLTHVAQNSWHIYYNVSFCDVYFVVIYECSININQTDQKL